MASKDRILRLKEATRNSILDAALQIVIYEHFANKDAILLELTRKGYLLLSKELKEAKSHHDSPAGQLEAMWIAYWNFAFANTELYQVMFGVSTNCVCDMVNNLSEAKLPWDLFSSSISELMQIPDLDSDIICTKYYTFWSVVHGLISINILGRNSSDDINRQVLRDAITGIIRSISP
jgi:AcrR family transcriptional regulator